MHNGRLGDVDVKERQTNIDTENAKTVTEIAEVT